MKDPGVVLLLLLFVVSPMYDSANTGRIPNLWLRRPKVIKDVDKDYQNFIRTGRNCRMLSVWRVA